MDPVVTLPQGQLRGMQTDGDVVAFLGIPYAQAPTGDNRFAEPTAPPSWTGVRDATQFGPTVPKPPYPVPLDAILYEPVIEGDECLNLNVWTLDLAGRAPVLVWIHGGAFVNGSGAAYNGTPFARDGVVCVTINYRLGFEGFGLIDGAPANRGLLDQIAALRWVRDNIATFGGDPDAVTIAGESAGAMSVVTLLSMPATAGLFRRAIAQSGAGHHVLRPETAAVVTAALAGRLGVEPTLAGFSSVPVDTLVKEQAELSASIAALPDPTRWREIAADMMAFEPTVDGDVLAAVPIDNIVAGVGRDIALLTGSNSDEHAMFTIPSGVADVMSDPVLGMILAGLGADPARVIGTYRGAARDTSAGDVMTAALGDWFFRIPMVRVVEARLALEAPTHVYEFTWRSPQFDGRLGACHALELGFVFDGLDDPELVPLTGGDPPQALADEMHAAWVAFVKTGEPGWPAYGSERVTRRFGTPSETVADPAADRRLVWEGIR